MNSDYNNQRPGLSTPDLFPVCTLHHEGDPLRTSSSGDWVRVRIIPIKVPDHHKQTDPERTISFDASQDPVRTSYGEDWVRAQITNRSLRRLAKLGSRRFSRRSVCSEGLENTWHRRNKDPHTPGRYSRSPI